MKKRLIALLLSTTLVFSLASCGTSEIQPSSSTPDTQGSGVVSEEPSESESEIEEEDTAQGYKADTLVELSYGSLEGLIVDDALVYTNVPYAKAPIGELRWKAPQDLESWEGVLDATQASILATQLADGEIVGDEDCLYLDIYRPNTDDTDLPVLYYIHGGNNQTGTSAELDASILAVETNSVVVSVNYRLGALGFVNFPALKTGDAMEDSGNFTLLDLEKSLDWIAQNISSFGGDKDNITISGTSAGGRDVMAMLISPIFDGKFHKAISLSGGMTLADYDESATINAQAFAPLVVEDGVKENEEEAAQWLLSDDEEVKDYLYSLTDDRIASLMGNASIRMEVFPHLFTDGTVLPTEGFETENYNDVPLIMLTSSGEFTLFMNFDPYFAEDNRSAELEFAQNYGNQLYELFNAEESAQTLAGNYTSPIYLCDFEYGENEPVVLEAFGQKFGAYHCVYIPFLTGKNMGFAAVFPAEDFDTEERLEIQDAFMSYIGNFLWSADPNGDELTTWEEWSSDTSKNNQMIFGLDENGVIIEMANERIVYDDVLAQMDADTTISQESKDYLIDNVLNGRWFSAGLDAYFN